jgi:hypothetical protein
VKRALPALAAALALAGCGGDSATSNGFALTPPAGWKDSTERAEVKTNGEFEAVYEGTPVDGITPTIVISRIEQRKVPTLQRATDLARKAVLTAFGKGSEPTVLVPERLGGEPALRFDYKAGPKRARYLQAKHGKRLFGLTLESAPAAYARNLETFEALRASWKWEGE